jgi:hypothetical protein
VQFKQEDARDEFIKVPLVHGEHEVLFVRLKYPVEQSKQELEALDVENVPAGHLLQLACPEREKFPGEQTSQ